MKDKVDNMNELKEMLKSNISIVDYYGVKKQIPVWIEEMSELTKELCKWLRKYDKLEGDVDSKLLNNIKEEITDVTICLDQLKYTIQFYDDDLTNAYKYKVDRQIKRINKEIGGNETNET